MARPQHSVAAGPPRQWPPPAWFLGFDCATKTFAFSLSRVDFGAWAAAAPRLGRLAAGAREALRRAVALAPADPAAAAAITRELEPALEAADRETASFVRIVGGAVVDLFPGRPDKGIATVERLRAVARYVRERVLPAVAAHVPPGEGGPRVVVEYQMGAVARDIAAALVTLFAEGDVVIVGPSLKNKVATCEEGRYLRFAERYRKSYDANKAHAVFNFARFEAAFGTGIPPTRPASLRGHIADSFMQVVGLLVFGPSEGAEALF